MRRRQGDAAQRAGDDRGFSLVGTLAAGAILSVVALSLVKGWAVFDGMSFDLLLRQKAVLVLNGEMERLWTIYTRTSFGDTVGSRSDYPAVTGLPNSATRSSYGSNALTSGFATNSVTTFTAQATPDAAVFLGSGTPPLNWVWLDRPRNLVARLSWRRCTVTLPDLQGCWGLSAGKNKGKTGTPDCFNYDGSNANGVCELVTLILEYPYNFNGGSPSAAGAIRRLTLSTVVGRRT